MSTKPDLNDVVALVGFIALVYGLAQWSTPAAWATGGGLLLLGALIPKLRRGPRPS